MPNLDAEVLNEPKKQIVKDFSKEEIVQIIQNAIDKGIINLGDIGGGSEVVANPTLEGTEPNLEGLEVDGEKYKIPEGTVVEANPTLVGTESPLTSLQVGDTKYSVGGGSGVHCYKIEGKTYNDNILVSIVTFTEKDLNTSSAENFARDIQNQIGANVYIKSVGQLSFDSFYRGCDSIYAYNNVLFVRFKRHSISIVNNAISIDTITVTLTADALREATITKLY